MNSVQMTDTATEAVVKAAKDVLDVISTDHSINDIHEKLDALRHAIRVGREGGVSDADIDRTLDEVKQSYPDIDETKTWNQIMEIDGYEPLVSFTLSRQELKTLAYHYLDRYFDKQMTFALYVSGSDCREAHFCIERFRTIADTLSPGEWLREFVEEWNRQWAEVNKYGKEFEEESQRRRAEIEELREFLEEIKRPVATRKDAELGSDAPTEEIEEVLASAQHDVLKVFAPDYDRDDLRAKLYSLLVAVRDARKCGVSEAVIDRTLRKARQEYPDLISTWNRFCQTISAA